MMLLDLCWSFVQVGLFSIGGGLAAIPLISHQVVDIHGWLTMAELTDLIAIAEATPGPIAVNVATFVGARLGGPIAATLATVSVILPGCVIALGLARLYMRYRSLPLLQGVLDGCARLLWRLSPRAAYRYCARPSGATVRLRFPIRT